MCLCVPSEQAPIQMESSVVMTEQADLWSISLSKIQMTYQACFRISLARERRLPWPTDDFVGGR
jgi:hypothetical protein